MGVPSPMPEGALELFEGWGEPGGFPIRVDDITAAAVALRYWERIAPHLDADAIDLAEGAADVADVVGPSWETVADAEELVSCYRHEDDRIRFIHIRTDGRWWMGPSIRSAADHVSGDAPSPAEAARCALAALVRQEGKHQ